MITTPVYCSREDVKSAMDFAETARSNAQVDRAIVAATRSVERLTLRKFYPQTDTRYFDWPDRSGSRPWRLWLDGNELVSVTTLTVAGVAIAATDFFLEPANSGPPYTHVEIDLSSSASFSAGDTHQRAISIAGVYCGCAAEEESVGSLTANLDADVNDTAAVSWTQNIGVGDILKIGSERLIVTGRSMVDSTQNLQGDMDASVADDLVAVTTGSAFLVDQVILIGTERMLITDIAGNNLTVKRAIDGTVLAAHTGAVDIFTYSGVDVERAQLGTTLAAHLSGAAVTRHLVPGPVKSLCIAEAINQLQQETSGYARLVGPEEMGIRERAQIGAGLPALRDEVRTMYGRRARVKAV